MKYLKKLVPFLSFFFVVGSAYALTTAPLQKNGSLQFLTSPNDSLVVGRNSSTTNSRLEVNGTTTATNFVATSTTATSTFMGDLVLSAKHLIANGIRAFSSSGIDVHSSNGQQVANFGAGGGSNATFYGGVNVNGALTGPSATFGSATVGTVTATSTTGTSTFPNASISLLSLNGSLINAFGPTLSLTAGTLDTVLGNTVDLASAEVTGITGVDNGGTGRDSGTMGGLTAAYGSAPNGLFYWDATNGWFANNSALYFDPAIGPGALVMQGVPRITDLSAGSACSVAGGFALGTDVDGDVECVSIPTTGGGGSGGGTFSTTTSQVSGVLVNYANNNTDVVTIGSNSTTTAEFFIDPNTNTLNASGTATTTIDFSSPLLNQVYRYGIRFFEGGSRSMSILYDGSNTGSNNKIGIWDDSVGLVERFTFLRGGFLGIGTTSPYAPLSVVGQIVAANFTATSGTSTLQGLSASYLTLNGGNITAGNATSTTLDATSITGTTLTVTSATTTNLRVSATSSMVGLSTSYASTTNLTLSRFFQNQLSDCNGASNKVTYVLASGSFGCEADQTGGGSGTATDTAWQLIPGGVRLSTTTNQVLIGASATQTTSSLEVQGTSTLSRLLVGGYGTTQQAGIIDASAYITGSSSGRSGVIMQNYGTGNAPEYRFTIGDPYSPLEYIAFGLTNSGATNGGALNGLQKNDLVYVLGNSGRDMLITNGQSNENVYITANFTNTKPVLKIDGATQRLGIGYATTTIGGSLLSVNGDAEVANFTATGTVTSSQSIFGSSTIGILNATSTTASSTMQGVDLNALRIRSLGAGLAKLNSSGYVGVATAGTDYENPLTFTSPIQRSSNTVFLNTGSLTIGALSATTSFTANTASIGTSSIGTLNATSSLNVMGTTTGNGASFTYLTLNGGNLTAGAISGTSITTTASSSISNLTIGTFASTTQLSVSRGFFQDGLPDCSTAGTSKLLYSLSSGKFSCGTDQTGGGSSRPSTYSYIVDTAGLGDFTTIQGALDACAAAGGGSIYLSNHYYYLGATGLKFKSNDCSVFGIYASTTIEIAGATTAFSTNSAASAYANNTISNVVIVGDGTAGSIGIDLSDLVRSRFTGITMDNLDIGFRVNDTQNVTHYSTVRDFVLTTMGSYGIYASSTNPANDIKWTDGFIGCTADCTGIHLNNTQAHIFSGISIEPGSTTGTIGVRIDVSGSAANNGTFSNQFMGIYIEGNKIGVSASSSIGTKIVLGNAFHGGQIVANTHDLLLSSSSSIETFGTIVNYETKTMLSTTSIASFLQDGFTDCTGTTFVQYTLSSGKFGCGTPSGGSGGLPGNIYAVGGKLGIGSSSPWASFSVESTSTTWYSNPIAHLKDASGAEFFFTGTSSTAYLSTIKSIFGLGTSTNKFGQPLTANMTLVGKVEKSHPDIDCAVFSGPVLAISADLNNYPCPGMAFDENTDADILYVEPNLATSTTRVIIVSAGTTAGAGAADGGILRTAGYGFSATSSPSVAFYWNPVPAPAATATQGRIFINGFTQEKAGGTFTRIPANFVGFVASGTDQNIKFVTSNGGSQTITDTGIATTTSENLAAVTLPKWEIGYNETEAYLIKNGVTIARHSTNIPTDTLNFAVAGSASPQSATSSSVLNRPMFFFGGLRAWNNIAW